MNGKQSFEEDVRELLDDMASEPAPDDLIARVQSIPAGHPPREAFLVRYGRRFAMTAAVAAVALVAFAASIALRPGNDGGPAIGASPGTSFATSSPVPTASASIAPQSPAARPAGSGVTGSPLPGGFSPVSVTFVSSERGFVLGSVPSENNALAKIAQTDDAGRTWTYSSIIPTTVATTAAAGPGQAGVSTLRFATASDGWAFGPQELWATHDGGSTWTKTTLPGLDADPTIQALETSAGLVHAVVLDCAADGCAFVVETAAVHGSDWRLAPLRLPVGAGPVPEVQLVLQGSTGWILQDDRVVVNGARLLGGTWETWTPPCADVQGPAVVAASSETDVVAVCDVGLWSNHVGPRLFVSRDGGATFVEQPAALPLRSVDGVAVASPSTIVVGGIGTNVEGTLVSGGSTVAESFDGGTSWQRTDLTGEPHPVVDPGFTTPTQGVVVLDGSLYMTRDGGHSWTAADL